MFTNFGELQSNLSSKDVASSTKGITQSSLNYLGYLINGSRFVKKSRRKSEHLQDLLLI